MRLSEPNVGTGNPAGEEVQVSTAPACAMLMIACPALLVSWTSVYDLAYRHARESAARLQWVRSWAPSAN